MQVQKIYRRRAVESFAGLKRSALYEAVARGRFPKPVRVTERCVGWLESDLLAWQASTIAERDKPKALDNRKMDSASPFAESRGRASRST
jgi:prophage regulatory protein